MRDQSRIMWISSTVLLLLAGLFTGANGSAQLYEFGPGLDESLDPADELYVEVSLIDPMLYIGVENSELYVSCTTSIHWLYYFNLHSHAINKKKERKKKTV